MGVVGSWINKFHSNTRSGFRQGTNPDCQLRESLSCSKNCCFSTLCLYRVTVATMFHVPYEE